MVFMMHLFGVNYLAKLLFTDVLTRRCKWMPHSNNTNRQWYTM